MKLKSLMTAAALAVATMAGGVASAATIAGTISANNEALGPLGTGNPLSGYFGGQIYLSGGPSDIKVTYLGAEAGFNNSFTMGAAAFNTGGGTNFFNPAGIGASVTLLGVSSGLLNFSFMSPLGMVANGANPDNTNPNLVNFFASFLPNPALSFGKGVLLFLDDAGGGSDDNHDDMVIALEIVNGGTFVAPVPLPAGGLLLIGALGGLAALRRRKAV